MPQKRPTPLFHLFSLRTAMMRVELLQFLDLFDLLRLRATNRLLHNFVDPPAQGQKHLVTFMEAQGYSEKVIEKFRATSSKLGISELVVATLENDMLRLQSYRVMLKNFDGTVCLLKPGQDHWRYLEEPLGLSF